jgi:dGTPase
MRFDLHACGVFGEAERALSARDYPAPASDGSHPFEGDRERVVQARAFRRLAGKTQVFTRRASDHFRSRLTHTIEVAQVARAVAGALGLNVDLAETLALVHDIGHPPFGHAGERALDRCLQQHGLSFDHNLHALRIVELFEQRYAGHPGLNLTLGTREGIIKHSRDYSEATHPELAAYMLQKQAPLEAQIIDLADEIAYLTADLDDGVESGLLEIADVRASVAMLGHTYCAVQQAHPGAEEKYLFHDALQNMQKLLVQDLIAETASRAEAADVHSLDAVRALPARLAALSPAIEAERMQGKSYLHAQLYTCAELEREHDRAEAVVTELFEYWVAHPKTLPDSYVDEIQQEGIARVVADYIAGMTDNFILQQYEEVRRFASAVPRSSALGNRD